MYFDTRMFWEDAVKKRKPFDHNQLIASSFYGAGAEAKVTPPSQYCTCVKLGWYIYANNSLPSKARGVLSVSFDTCMFWEDAVKKESHSIIIS